MTTDSAISLSELNRRITRTLAAADGLANVWVTGETSSLRVAGGHCYMDLVEKDAAGNPVAKCRAVIWASTYNRLSAIFAAETGTRLRDDMKIMVRVTVNYHAFFGLSLVITDINADYTVGDLARRRNAIINRLRAEGVFELNRSLPFPELPQRVAIISARGAAGYGDFVRQLHDNPMLLRFDSELFEATMQGERTAPTIIAALERVMERIDSFDVVVLIRGGGAGIDLAAFDDYDLAAAIAQFPLPVIVGIGHERDITVLDYVANIRVKTPTAAAAVLIDRLRNAYAGVCGLGHNIMEAVRSIVAGRRQQLAYSEGMLPALAAAALSRAQSKITAFADTLASVARHSIELRKARLDALGDVLEAISPEATLRRGYSITRADGHAITSAAALTPGATLETSLADGSVIKSTFEGGKL